MDNITTRPAARSVPAQTWFGDLVAGQALPPRSIGPMTTLHIMRWSAAMENWHRIHYDQRFARDVDGLPDVLVNGSWKQQILCHYMKDFAGRQGWLWRIRFEFRDMDVVGNTVIAAGSIEELAARDGLGYARCALRLTNQLGKTTTNGMALVVLPQRGGPPVPYPFVPPANCPLSW